MTENVEEYGKISKIIHKRKKLIFKAFLGLQKLCFNFCLFSHTYINVCVFVFLFINLPLALCPKVCYTQSCFHAEFGAIVATHEQTCFPHLVSFKLYNLYANSALFYLNNLCMTSSKAFSITYIYIGR